MPQPLSMPFDHDLQPTTWLTSQHQLVTTLVTIWACART